MIKQMKATICILATALMFGTATTEAGTLTIYNKNCTKVLGFKKHKRVTVHIYEGDIFRRCMDTKVTINQAQSKTINLKMLGKGGISCLSYTVEAMGTTESEATVKSDQDSHVTCKKNRIGYCVCNKD